MLAEDFSPKFLTKGDLGIFIETPPVGGRFLLVYTYSFFEYDGAV
tara:strand:+ start:577 stop:711 length:135 start_codon:yes stop_codon:yes gene_type:complete